MIGWNDDRPEHPDSGEDDDPDGPSDGVCANCHCASDCATEIIEWSGDDEIFFCGQDCRHEFYEDQEEEE